MGTQGKHTPGPWYWNEGWGAICAGEDRMNPDMLVTPIWKNGVAAWGDETNRANAQLIAAAPELYEALRIIADWDPAASPGEKGGMSIIDAIDLARAAIALAESGKGAQG